jgi:hypothetical protein
MIAHTLVHVSTPLPEDVLQSVIAYVEEKFNRHEKAIIYKSDEDKKVDALIITLLDVAAELSAARQEIKKLKQLDSDSLAEVDIMNKRLDELVNQIEK